MSVLEGYLKLNHSNIAKLREAFATSHFGDYCNLIYPLSFCHFPFLLIMNHLLFSADEALIFVYEFYPMAQSLLQAHFFEDSQGFFSEDKIWSYIIQLASALREIHSLGLYCRTIDLTKIMLTSKNRFGSFSYA